MCPFKHTTVGLARLAPYTYTTPSYAGRDYLSLVNAAGEEAAAGSLDLQGRVADLQLLAAGEEAADSRLDNAGLLNVNLRHVRNIHARFLLQDCVRCREP
jgi:hypothetical protein